jgi:ATP-binding cassette subfamily F protein 3
LLEALIAGFTGAVVVVSHDRYLLDETVDAIASLDGGRLRLWPGNYSAYALARELETQRQQVLYTTQQKEIERLEAAVRRFRDWAHRVVNERHARQARVKQRQIERMEKIERPVLERRKIALRLHPHARGGQRVFDARRVTVAFAGEPILADVDLTVLHGERVGVVGANGAGKSLLLKTFVGEIEPVEGEVWIGPSIRIGYLAQDQETLDPAVSPLATVRAAHRCSEGEAVSLLLKFLFPYEQVRRPNRLLSGGERTRLQLLLLMLSGANVLVLDEPTNHLDIDSVEVLESALEGFEGTVVFTSHDRYFLDRIADRIVEVADGAVTAYEGGFSDWFERRERAAAAASA